MKYLRLFIYIIILTVVVSLLISCVLPIFFSGRIFDNLNDIEPASTILVLGARALSDEVPGAVFKGRLDAAFKIYSADMVSKVIVSGDHGRKQYDEVNAGRTYLLSLGMAPEDIFLDHAGFDTYDSIYRAKNIFELDQAIIVSNGFHLPRALLIADSVGLDAIGYQADWPYRSYLAASFREVGARLKAFSDIIFSA